MKNSFKTIILDDPVPIHVSAMHYSAEGPKPKY